MYTSTNNLIVVLQNSDGVQNRIKKSRGMNTMLQELNNASSELLKTLSTKEMYQTIVEQALHMVNGKDGLIFLEMNGKLINVFGSSLNASSVVARNRGHAYRSLKKDKAFVLDYEQFKTTHPEIIKTGVTAALFIPLSLQNRAFGYIVVRSYTTVFTFTEDEFSLLKLYGSLASMAIKKVHLNSDLDRALEVRDLFIALAGHELRTPLTTINGYIQLLAKRLSVNKSEELGWLLRLNKESKRMTVLVEELLEINRIKSGVAQYEFKLHSFKKIISKAIQQFYLEHPTRKIEQTSELSQNNDYVIADFDRLSHALTHILDNAAKYSPADKKISVELHNNSSSLILTITDFGQGINKNDIQKIFDEFYKPHNNHKKGIGIGLYVVKSIIKQHHGSIKIRSKLSKGTIVTVKLPKYKI